jgi:hypothetical protein
MKRAITNPGARHEAKPAIEYGATVPKANWRNPQTQLS